MANCKICGTELQIRKLKTGEDAYYCPTCKKGFRINALDKPPIEEKTEEIKKNICKYCGTELQIRKLKTGDDAYYCPTCKKGFKINKEEQKPKATPPKVMASAIGLGLSPNSEFTGSVFGYFGYSILTALLGCITLGIMVPWCVCWQMGWETENTIINGKRLSFDGSGGELFGKYIIWFLLSIVTIGIYAWTIPGQMRKFQVEHTHFEDSRFSGPIKITQATMS